jgi:hypothetical protein
VIEEGDNRDPGPRNGRLTKTGKKEGTKEEKGVENWK